MTNNQQYSVTSPFVSSLFISDMIMNKCATWTPAGRWAAQSLAHCNFVGPSSFDGLPSNFAIFTTAIAGSLPLCRPTCF